MSEPFQPTIYAIDFGTSNSLLAAAAPGKVSPPIPLDTASAEPSIFRSILFFSEESEWHFGAEALRSYVESGTRGRFIRSMKRFLPMQSFLETRIGTRKVLMEELVSVFLREMRERANRYFNADVRRVLLGRPARFSENVEADEFAQMRLERAAYLAGFEEVYFCPEPVAAAYDFKTELSTEKTVLVADFGGGTSDYTVVRLLPGGESAEVLAIGGVPVAGDALDGSIMRGKIVRHFGAEVKYRVPFGNNVLTMPRPLIEQLCSPAELCLLNRRDVTTFFKDVRSWSLGEDDKERMDQLLVLVEDVLGFQLFEAIEGCKKQLSDIPEVRFAFEYPGISVEEPITRPEFETFSERQTSTILQCLDQTVSAAKLNPADIDLVCSTGGTARVPVIARAIEERFGAGKLHRLSSFHSVIQGLAQRAMHYA